MNKQKELEVKAAVFDRLMSHLQENTDIQNIDLMITGKFCRNCFYKWYKEAADHLGENVTLEQAQEKIYGMPYIQYKEKYQKPATKAQLEAFKKIHPGH